MDNQIVNIQSEYYPSIPRESIIKHSTYQIPVKELSSLGSGFAITAAEFVRIAMQSPSTEGLYRCVFPKGVTGSLAMFRDGSGYVGTIMNNSGIVGQARWLPVEANAAVLPVDPVTIAIAVAMVSINMKLDAIHQTQLEILNFLRQDKEAELEGAVNTLANILDHYRFNSDNSVWKQSQLVIATSMKALAEHNIIFYRKQIEDVINKKKLIHDIKHIDKQKDSLNKNFKYYQLGVYLFSFSSFLETLLGNNYSGEFLKHVVNKIDSYSIDYQKDYTDCYFELQKIVMNAIDANAFKKLGNVNLKAGQAIAKIPIIRKGPVDEILQLAGNKMVEHSTNKTENILDNFKNNRESGIKTFSDSIKAINTVSNQPIEMFFDSETIYLLEGKKTC